MIDFLFYISLLFFIYTYLMYPLIVFITSMFYKRRIKRAEIYPSVAVIIPVHNEERTIARKIENCLKFDYPEDKLEIIVVSDCSDDDTEKIVRRFSSDRVIFREIAFRGGKMAAQNFATRFCQTEIIAFTDVAISTEPECIKLIVQNFADPEVGAVSCRDAIVGSRPEEKGERDYIRYDMLVREYSSMVGSIIGVTGGFYAVRREIASGGWNPAFPPDFYVALRCLKRKQRVVEDARVRAFYKTAAQEWDEFPRKVRTINRGMNALLSLSNRKLLNPFRFGIIAIQLISHKFFRWLTPFFLVLVFVSSLLLVGRSAIATIVLIPQIFLYAAAGLVFMDVAKARKSAFCKRAFYFVIANLAVVRAWYEYAVGKKYVVWSPTKR